MGAQRTLSPLRANETTGPVPEGPSGRCGCRLEDAAMPGVMGDAEPKISAWMRFAATPHVRSPAIKSFMKAVGPQT